MYDYGLSTLEQYHLTARASWRTRGALLCQTEKGLLILREFNGSEKKLGRQQELLQKLQDDGCLVDTYLENADGMLVSRDKDDIGFTLQNWYEGRECDTRNPEDIIKSVSLLAKMHKSLRLAPEEDYREKPLGEEFLRHNQELRKIRKFIRKKGASNLFEKEFLGSVEEFLKKGEEALELLRQSSYEKLRQEAMQEGRVCHGEFNQHNVLILKNDTAATHFERWKFDLQIGDLYCFMRKVLEKCAWDLPLARRMLLAYHRVNPISEAEWENLRVRFTYPEKYWKLANYYYSHNKAWISEKNIEKLKKLKKQQEVWQDFAQRCFEKYPY